MSKHDSKKDDSNKQKAKKAPKQQAKVNELEQKVEELTADLLRSQADYINFKRRAEEERGASIEFGAKQTIIALLPTLDNINRALLHVPGDLENNDWAKGVKQIAQQLYKELERLGVVTIGEPGEVFNPELHEAVAVEGEGNNEEVAEVLQSGFKLNDSIIRPAMVKVQKKQLAFAATIIATIFLYVILRHGDSERPDRHVPSPV